MKLREHRRLLDESLATTIEIEPTREALLGAINAAMLGWSGFPVTEAAVSVKPYCFDDRIGWNTHIVCIKDWGVYGFTDGSVTEQPKEKS